MFPTLASHSDDVAAAPAAQPSRPTLLLVDDEEGPRASLRVIFKDEFNLLTASDGAAAIELAQANPVDVAVLDIRMGGMSGIDVLERLKSLDPTIEVVMMTAFETNDTIRQALRLRACDYISKPFDISTMRAAVNTALERRNLGIDLRQSAADLQQLQAELHQQKLEDELARSRGDIYASVLHDINGPLTVISGLIQTVNQSIGEETQVNGEDLELVKDRLKRVTRQVTRCIEISRRYLGFLRKNPQEPVHVWVNQVLGDLGELLRMHPSAKNNALIIHPLPEDVTAHIHGIDLIQVFLNLTLNALQCSTQQHRVEILGQLSHQPLDVAVFRDGPTDLFINREGFNNAPPHLALSVQDNGPGIPADVLPKIFEPFFTGTTRPQGTGQGTGLGLCIVHRLLKQAQGALHVYSKVGQGTIFTVYLPASVASPSPTLAPSVKT